MQGEQTQNKKKI